MVAWAKSKSAKEIHSVVRMLPVAKRTSPMVQGMAKGQTMSKYYKAEDVINAIEDKIAEHIPTLYGRYGEIPLELRMAIEHLPTIDIVPCKDCRHYIASTKGCGRNPCIEAWESYDFCSYGEWAAE